MPLSPQHPPKDGASYLVVPKAQLGPLSLATAGAFTARGALPSPAGSPGPGSGANYALGVDNTTFHALLSAHGAANTTVTLLLLLTGNVTLAPHPALPAGGFNITRPVVMMGVDGVTTGIDFGGKVGGWWGHDGFWLSRHS